MYNSSLKKNKGTSVRSVSGKSDIISMSGLDVAVRPILDNNTSVNNGRFVIKKALSERCFIAHCSLSSQDVVIKGILNEENIQTWIDLPLHTNIITCFEQFTHDNK